MLNELNPNTEDLNPWVIIAMGLTTLAFRYEEGIAFLKLLQKAAKFDVNPDTTASFTTLSQDEVHYWFVPAEEAALRFQAQEANDGNGIPFNQFTKDI